MTNLKTMKQNHVKVVHVQEKRLKIGVQDLIRLKVSHLLMRNRIFRKLLNIRVVNNRLFLTVDFEI